MSPTDKDWLLSLLKTEKNAVDRPLVLAELHRKDSLEWRSGAFEIDKNSETLRKFKGEGVKIYQVEASTALGRGRLVYSSIGIHLLSFETESDHYPGYGRLTKLLSQGDWQPLERVEVEQLVQLIDQLSAHLAPLGSEFQQRVWRLLGGVPLGQVCQYADLARQIGSTRYARAVGQAVAKNPIALLIPCHRVLGKNGEVGNFRWSGWRKARALADEKILYATR